MAKKDIRWEQRFSNYNRALHKLDEAVQRIKPDFEQSEDESVSEDEFLDDVLKEAVIQRFEYTHELAWNVMKDYLKEVGDIKAIGSKDATKEAFAAGLIQDGETWMEMINSRNKTSHTYNEETANEIFSLIMKRFHPAFLQFRQVMEEKRSGTQGEMYDEA